MFAISFGAIGWFVLSYIATAFAGWFFISKGLNWLQKNRKQ